MRRRNNPMRGTGYRATSRDIIAISDLLKQHIIKAENDKYTYEGDWTDAKIASATGNPKLRDSHVRHVRVELYGNLHMGGLLRQRARNMRERLASVEERLDKLEDALGVSSPNGSTAPPLLR